MWVRLPPPAPFKSKSYKVAGQYEQLPNYISSFIKPSKENLLEWWEKEYHEYIKDINSLVVYDGRNSQDLTNNMSKAAGHHWVPKFYLRYFAIPETRHNKIPQVWVFHKKQGDPFLLGIDKIAKKRNLYSNEMEARLADL